MALGRTRLSAVSSMPEALALLGELGYSSPARPIDIGEFALTGLSRASVLRSNSLKRLGYGVVVAEAPSAPRSLRPVAKTIRERIHDRPLGVLGITGPGGAWERMIVFRPRRQGQRVTLTKLDVDLTHPTQHDARVLEALAWSGEASQDAVDRALDVEAVTARFFKGLKDQYDRLRAAIGATIDRDVALASQVKGLDEPAQRLALRVLVQVLFCEFLQRKGFIEGRSDWLSWAWGQKVGPYYQTVLEPLFYDALGTPLDQRPVAREVPYLNGGLFERPYGHLSMELGDELFDPRTDDGLLGYLNGWTFTIAEEMPEEAEVAVDPEMLGKVFEHLAGKENIQTHGTVYTPRPVVHFMCREALVPWLCGSVGLSENQSRHLLTDPAPIPGLVDELGTTRVAELAESLPGRLDDLAILDPAVGSGAFPLGMLGEIVRLRRICHLARYDQEPSSATVHAWKLASIEHCLVGVDIEPRAIELCRLRLWLSLVVDLPEGEVPAPLPNLEFRTICANSLVDFVHGIEVQNSRAGGQAGLAFFAEPELVSLHHTWFSAAGADAKVGLRAKIAQIEGQVVGNQLATALRSAKTDAARAAINQLAGEFAGVDRAFPCFVPALHAPEVAGRGGWDIVIMNPPYVGHKKLGSRMTDWARADLEYHYTKTNDLMILFARRAFELVRAGGVVSMIFNDSIFTSTDADELRRYLTDEASVLALARTKCFEGMAVNGGVVVAAAAPSAGSELRWVEGYKRDVADFTQASDVLPAATRVPKAQAAGSLELWRTPVAEYARLPSRPLFRPSPEARAMLARFEACEGWAGQWSHYEQDAVYGAAWTTMSNTAALNKRIEALRRSGFYEHLRPRSWVLLGLVIEGGQGLATADDRRFLAAIEGTVQAEVHRANQAKLVAKTLEHPEGGLFYAANEHRGVEAALLACWERFGDALRWPKGATFRLVEPDRVHAGPVSASERRDGIAGECCFLAFEKGDSSDEVDGHAIGATWWRDNPMVIEWSVPAVALLRRRAKDKGAKSPRLQNEQLWFEPGVTWNRVASYLRPRMVPAGSIFSDKAPTVRSMVPWLSTEGLCALLFSDTADFTLRTFLGSRMMLEIGDIRRIPIPVLDEDHAQLLSQLGTEAVAAKSNGGADRPLAEIEAEVNATVRGLYGLRPDADLWVVR